MKFEDICTAVFMATTVDVRIYPKGNKINQYIELEVDNVDGSYLPFQQLKLTRGKRKGKIIFKLQTWDYTTEHLNRKAKWKLAGRIGHISKVYPIAPDKAWIDFKTLDRPDDIGLILFDECLEYGKVMSMKIFIVEDRRNDPGVIQMFLDTDFS